MNVKKDILLNTSKYVNQLFDRKSTIAALYHNFDHTLEVVKNVNEISTALDVNPTNKEIVLLAAWFHDTGYLFSPVDHEERSVTIASEFLRSLKFSDSKISRVAGCIRATKVPQKPKTELEKIMSDADLLHLGKRDSIERGEMLRAEIESMSGKLLPEEDWIKQSISFHLGHHYHTTYAIQKYTSNRDRNLKILQKRLKSLEEKRTHRSSKSKARVKK
ncbi:MAG: HD domain-containing protein [Bacteriovoracaceae bacterium]|nr:HD domain-containing protein [Bacteroidota bacterium]